MCAGGRGRGGGYKNERVALFSGQSNGPSKFLCTSLPNGKAVQEVIQGEQRH